MYCGERGNSEQKTCAFVHFLETHPSCEGNYYANKLLATVFKQREFENKGAYCVAKVDTFTVSKLNDGLGDYSDSSSKRKLSTRANILSNHKEGKTLMHSILIDAL